MYAPYLTLIKQQSTNIYELFLTILNQSMEDMQYIHSQMNQKQKQHPHQQKQPNSKSHNTLQTFTSALKFSSYKHREQRRKKGDIPYINHPIEVADILSQVGINDYEILSAAILHDTIEDTQTTYEQLEEKFGHNIAKMVMECTDDKKLGKVDRKRIQITKSPKCSHGAKLVKIADKISNLWDIKNNGFPASWSKERAEGYFLWAWAVCIGLYGVHEKLDDKMEGIFQASGYEGVGMKNLKEKQLQGKQQVQAYQKHLNQKLQNYYVILGNSPGDKS